MKTPRLCTVLRPPPVALVLALILGSALGGCGDDSTAPRGGRGGEVGVVLNSVDVTLTIFPVDTPGVTRTVALAPDGSPVGVAARGRWAAVPLGIVPAVAVVDLGEDRLVHSVALPENSGATGAVFVSDTVVLVGNPNRGTVSPVNVRTGLAGPEIAVGDYPHALVVAGDRVGVLDARLGPDFLPTGPGSVAVLDRESLEPLGTVELSGLNPGDAAVAPDGRVLVVSSGTFGAANGSVSVVDLNARLEVAHHVGFGEFPFAAATGPDGRLHVGSFGYGIAVWDPDTAAFVRGPGDAVTPAGIPSVSGLAFDAAGRLYSLRPECSGPGAAYRLSDAFDVEAEVTTGTCPIDLAFGRAGGE